MPMLKVLIPGLSDITLLDHQNTGATAPCVTTGESCISWSANKRASPEDILQGRPGLESADILVTAKRIETINHTEQTCEISIEEKVETEIRGKKLFHTRENSLGSRPYGECARGVVP